MIHKGTTDQNGNYRNQTRKREGYFDTHLNGPPFPALVVAWYPKSQTIDVNVPTRFGQTTLEKVVVYGNFFEATGTIQGPKIAATLGDDGYTTVRDDEQKNPSSDKYVLNNNIEALVTKTSIGYAASSFRFLSADSPLLNNVKPGRKITRHDDGSFYIHDEDGNSQFVHPSGFKFRLGNSTDDIDLDVPFPPHEKNEQDYNSQIIARLDHPAGTYSEYSSAGAVKHYSASTMDFESVGDMGFKAPNINSEATTKLKNTAPNIEEIASTKFKVTSPESEMTGNLTVGGVIKAAGDIIADYLTTAITLLTHFSQGNLGFPTGTPIQSGGGTTPSSPPSSSISGDLITGSGTSLDNHDHDFDYEWTEAAGSDTGTTNSPN